MGAGGPSLPPLVAVRGPFRKRPPPVTATAANQSVNSSHSSSPARSSPTRRCRGGAEGRWERERQGKGKKGCSDSVSGRLIVTPTRARRTTHIKPPHLRHKAPTPTRSPITERTGSRTKTNIKAPCQNASSLNADTRLFSSLLTKPVSQNPSHIQKLKK